MLTRCSQLKSNLAANCICPKPEGPNTLVRGERWPSRTVLVRDPPFGPCRSGSASGLRLSRRALAAIQNNGLVELSRLGLR